MRRAAGVLLALMVLLGCTGEATQTPGPTRSAPSEAAASPTATQTATVEPISVPTATPTPTPVVVVQASATPTASPTPQPSGGILEIRIVDPLGGDADCLAEAPFLVTQDGERFMVDGGGPLDCTFVNSQPPLGTHHPVYDLETTLMGEVITGMADQPQGALHAELFLQGGLTQFYTEIPEEIVQICTEGSPCTFPPQSDPLMLVMPFEEGATVYLTKGGMVSELGGDVAAWTITLHPGR